MGLKANSFENYSKLIYTVESILELQPAHVNFLNHNIGVVMTCLQTIEIFKL